MAEPEQDKLQELTDIVNAIQDTVDNHDKMLSTKGPEVKAVPIRLNDIPQGPGSRLDGDTVDGINANSRPFPNCLVPLDSNGQFPASTIPTSNTSLLMSIVYGDY